MRFAMPCVALLLVFSMTPGAGELAESTVHLVTHGDNAHGDSAGHQDRGESGGEHGCSGPYHSCSCHQSVSFLTATALDSGHLAAPSSHEAGSIDSVLDSGFVQELLRPPNA